MILLKLLAFCFSFACLGIGTACFVSAYSEARAWSLG